MENLGSIPRRRFMWTEALENMLIEMWTVNISDLRKAKRNGHVYKKISKDIEESTGAVIGIIEITVKIKNLTRRYREAKKEMGCSGGSPSQWPLYNKVHEILGSFPSQNLIVEESILQPAITLEEVPTSSLGTISPSPEASPNTSEDAPASRKAKKRKNHQELMLQEFKRANSIAESLAQEANDVQRDANNLLERSLRIQEGILQRLG